MPFAARRRRLPSSAHALSGALLTLFVVASLLVGCLAHGGEADVGGSDEQLAEAEWLDSPGIQDEPPSTAQPQVDSGLSSAPDDLATMEFSRLLRLRLEAADSGDAGATRPVLEDEVVTESQIEVDSSLSIARELLEAAGP